MLNLFQLVKLYFLTLPVYLVVDGLWLLVIAKEFYAKHLGYLMTPKPNLFAAGVFYLGYVVGILIFAVTPALRDNSFGKAIMLGALFGMFCYATYDLTNLATVRDWPWFIAIIDIVWGATVSLIVAGAGFWIGKRFI